VGDWAIKEILRGYFSSVRSSKRKPRRRSSRTAEALPNPTRGEWRALQAAGRIVPQDQNDLYDFGTGSEGEGGPEDSNGEELDEELSELSDPQSDSQ